MRVAFWTMAAMVFSIGTSDAAHRHGFHGRQYYSRWLYFKNHNYYYSNYYFTPTPTSTDYDNHYCICYAAKPRYYYYFNPRRKVFWGRYDLQAKGYSLLAEKDRKTDLKDIPEEAFPKPGPMPVVPGTKDNLQMAVPPEPPMK